MDIGTDIAARRPRLGAVAEAPQVRSDQPVVAMQPVHQRQPGHPEFRPAMQQQHRRTVADLRHMQRRVANRDLPMAQARRKGEIGNHR